MGQRAKAKKGKIGDLVRTVFFVEGNNIACCAEADGVRRVLCARAEVQALVNNLRNEIIVWSKERGKPEEVAESTDEARKDHFSESANRLMALLKVDGLKAPSGSKSDLYLTFKQPNGTKVTQGFSVKSLMGSNSCLVNHSPATLVTFEVRNCDKSRALQLEDEYLREVVLPAREQNRKGKKKPGPDGPPKLGPATIIPALARAKGVSVEFSSIPHETFRRNLIGVDTGMPEMLAQLVYQRFLTGESSPGVIVGLPSSIEMMSKMGHPRDDAARTLERKVKDLFQRYAQGMNSAKPWDDLTKVKGGWVLVIKDGKVTGYCFVDEDGFRRYLFESTYFDTPDVKRVPVWKKEIGAFVGRPYDFEGKTYVDLSLIVKFNKKAVTNSDKGQAVPPG